MGAAEELAVNAGNTLLGHGPIGILALIGWLCVVLMAAVVVVMWKAVRASEAAKVQYLLDDRAASEKERAEQERKMDLLQATLQATLEAKAKR